MYGMHIHKKVIDSNDKETGITIHFVSKEYDSGEIIFQRKISVNKGDNASSIEKKVHNFLKHLFLIRLDLKSLHLHNH